MSRKFNTSPILHIEASHDLYFSIRMASKETYQTFLKLGQWAQLFGVVQDLVWGNVWLAQVALQHGGLFGVALIDLLRALNLSLGRLHGLPIR